MSAETIERLGVVGAGQMGRGIAEVAASAGLVVTLCDATLPLATRGKDMIAAGLEKLVAKGKVGAAERDSCLARITPADGFTALAAVDLAIEAVPEQIDLKLDIVRAVDRALSPGALFASNTSSISITRIAAATSRAEHVIGMHFMNPVPRMQLVEIVRGLATSEATFVRVRDLAVRLGKTVITSLDRPGFIVNRMLIPFLNEACFALEESLGTAEDIDAGARLGLNHPMGPLELADFIGLDTCLAIAEVLHREIGDPKYRPAVLLRNHVAAGWLGKKSGRGFYRYDAQGKRTA